MSLRVAPSAPIPAETVRIAQAAFPKGTLCMQMRDTLGPIYEDGQFAALFSQTGQPAAAPARLALVLVLQFAEGLSDRQAADAVRGRIDWKYALALELTDPGFGLDHGIGHFMLFEADSAARVPTPRTPVLPQTSSAASDRKSVPLPSSRLVG